MRARWIITSVFLLAAARAQAAGGPAIMPLPNDRTALRPANSETIVAAVRSHLGVVKGCFERGLALQPGLAGRILVDFRIGQAGRVTAVSSKSTLDAPAVESCVVEAIPRWQFPTPTDGQPIDVTYPFVFMEPRLGFVNPGGVDFQRLDARLVVHRSMDAAGVPANGMIAVTEKGLLLVDTAWTDAQTEMILDWGRKALGREWVGAVITHDHGDRAGGVGALLRRHIPVAALDLTVAKLAARGVRPVATLFTAAAKAVKDPRGFEAFYPGRGHAPDNIVIAFPWSDILFAGCLVKAAEATELGFTGDANFASWPAALRAVRDRYPEMTIVPGHGSPEGTVTIQHTLDLLDARAK